MIKAEIARDGDEITVSALGHAGYAPEGSDIVCAAMSALCISFSITLDELEEKGVLSQRKGTLERGEFRCEFEDISGCGSLLALMLINGVDYLAGRYPGCVSLRGSGKHREETYERLPALIAGLKGTG